jgi:hypothetical protein
MNELVRPRSAKAPILRIYRLEGWKEKIVGRWNYQDLLADPAWFKGWISFDTIVWNPHDQQAYYGLNSMDSDLLYRFDPSTERFEGLNTQQSLYQKHQYCNISVRHIAQLGVTQLG